MLSGDYAHTRLSRTCTATLSFNVLCRLQAYASSAVQDLQVADLLDFLLSMESYSTLTEYCVRVSDTIGLPSVRAWQTRTLSGLDVKSTPALQVFITIRGVVVAECLSMLCNFASSQMFLQVKLLMSYGRCNHIKVDMMFCFCCLQYEQAVRTPKAQRVAECIRTIHTDHGQNTKVAIYLEYVNAPGSQESELVKWLQTELASELVSTT